MIQKQTKAKKKRIRIRNIPTRNKKRKRKRRGGGGGGGGRAQVFRIHRRGNEEALEQGREKRGKIRLQSKELVQQKKSAMITFFSSYARERRGSSTSERTPSNVFFVFSFDGVCERRRCRARDR